MSFPGTGLSVLIGVYAYDAANYQFLYLPSGLKAFPDWVGSTAVSIQARTSRPATMPELKQMLQTLLADRFHLQVRWTPIEMPAYTLELASGNSPTPADPNDKRATSMDEFAKFLSGLTYGAVVNKTGLPGKYQYSPDAIIRQFCRAAIVPIVPHGALVRPPEPGAPADCHDQPTLEDLLATQYHLKLVKHDKYPVDVLQVVHIDHLAPDA